MCNICICVGLLAYASCIVKLIFSSDDTLGSYVNYNQVFIDYCYIVGFKVTFFSSSALLPCLNTSHLSQKIGSSFIYYDCPGVEMCMVFSILSFSM